MRKYYVRVNRGNRSCTEAYNSKMERDKVVNWEHGRAISAKEARKLDKNYCHMIGGSDQPWKTF